MGASFCLWLCRLLSGCLCEGLLTSEGRPGTCPSQMGAEAAKPWSHTALHGGAPSWLCPQSPGLEKLVDSFFQAAITSHHTLGSVGQQEFILSHFWRPESGVEVSLDKVLLRAGRENVSGLSPSSWRFAGKPWLSWARRNVSPSSRGVLCSVSSRGSL